MIIGIFLLITFLLQCFSIEDESKVKLFDISNGTKIDPDWEKESQCQSRSWTIENGNPVVCSTNDTSTENCSVLYGLYDVSKANELYVNVSTETRINSTDKVIRRTFRLFALYGDRKNQDEVFTKFVQTLPNSISGPTSDVRFFKTNDLVSFSKNQSYSNVRLRLQEFTYCGTVKLITLFYYNCPTKTAELVDFIKEAAPSKLKSPKVLKGKCTRNANQISSPLIMYCYFNGTFEISGSCVCKAGFTNLDKKCEG